MLPNFLIVGAEKAGTTTLAAMLAEHPEVFISEPKEPRFFTEAVWGKGLAWYESLFDEATGFKAIGEASPAYTWAPEPSVAETPRRIKDTLGDIKYVYILRHPIERIASHCRHAVLNHWIPARTSMQDAVRLSPGLKNCSRYYFQIEQFLPYAGPEQWHVIVLEELSRDPMGVQRSLYQFLGIDNNQSVALKKENVGDEVRRVPGVFAPFKALKSVVPSSVVARAKRLGQRMGNTVDRFQITTDESEALLDELRPDIRRLGEFCGRDFFEVWGISRD